MQQATSFHPAVQAWFGSRFSAPTPAQAQAWPRIQAGQNVLIAAPTGSGKTLAAFLSAIDALVRKGLEDGLPDETFVVYVSPLKALSNDIQKNLAEPLEGIRTALAAGGYADVDIRTLVRTGDSPQHERASMRKRPPHIVVTTPESLYVLLGSDSGRSMLATTRTVIVDEIHALASNKRGSHLSLSLERLEALTATPPVRIGLSATQRPIEAIARFLCGVAEEGDPPRDCVIVDTGHIRARDLAIAVPSSPLEAVMSGDVWKEVYAQLAQLATEHRTTLVFVNTRRMSERVARQLTDLLGQGNVMSHHGSMAKELRLAAEQRLKNGELRVLVATASLELGIDIGDVDLVCQLGSPRSIAAFLQRAGRARHQVGGVPKARLFPLSRDELVECTALLEAVNRGELDAVTIPAQPLDVLAQQIVAEVAAREWPERDLFERFRRAAPYAELTEESFLDVVRTLADGYATRRGQRSAYVHRDAVHGVLRGRRGARLVALTSGGAIPDTADYDVVLEPAGQMVGTVNEDFAVESLAGDIFQLGNTSYRILRVEAGRVRVEDAHGQPPTIPFWLGEAPGRSDELSHAVSRLRERLEASLRDEGVDAAVASLRDQPGLSEGAARQLAEYLASALNVLGALPTHRRVVFERFFDESGGMQLVVHSPFGSRLNRAWGLALRKRFCVKFDFELQAAATEDAIVLSLSTSHSFPLEEVARYLNANTVREVLIQAMLVAPMFAARWRWIAGVSLALPRFAGGKKVPAPLQRMRAEDLMAAVFPDGVACAENVVGPREIPDHPLVRQAVHDCLHEAMDIVGLERILRELHSGAIEVVARDLPHPSPLALEILTARPYAYLDDAPLEERRTQAVMARRWLDDASAAGLGRLDPAAIGRVRLEAWPEAGNADELHDALLGLTFVTGDEVRANQGWQQWLADLATARRATQLSFAADSDPIWVPAERLPLFDAVREGAPRTPDISAPEEFARRSFERDEALAAIVRGRLEGLGPVTVDALAAPLGASAAEVSTALARLAGEGVAMQGSFTPGAAGEEWCDRGLLARIHRYTVQRLRAEIEPVSTRDFMRFLFRWQHAIPGERREGPDALHAVIAQLQGFEAPAAAWEAEILPARLDNYDFTWLDDLCLSGRVVWTRLTLPASAGVTAAGPIRTTPVTLLPRRSAPMWSRVAASEKAAPEAASSRAEAVATYLREHGASFFDEIVDGTNLLRTQVEEALAELVALGRVSSDSFSGLRALLTPSDRRKPLGGRKRHRRSAFGIEDAGRWALLKRAQHDGTPSQEVVEAVVHALLRRYGVVFWRLLSREAQWLPPWRDLVRVLRRLEARGDLRGGRFVAGISGEQFALPEAVSALREARRAPLKQAFVALSGADPLNLAGILLPGAKVPALASNRVVFRDGVPVGALVGGDVQWLAALEPADARLAEDLLVRRQAGSPLLAYLK
jgi:ATP-dependent Lhr-like helicase